jgi:TonB family protein
MKLYPIAFIIINLILLSCSSNRSLKTNNENIMLDPVFIDASFPGGIDEMYKFITDNLKYPQEALENEIEGRVITEFVVEVDGSITDIKVLFGMGYGCDEEAIRIISLMPKFKPAEFATNGMKVRQYWNLPITFKLPEKDSLNIKDSIFKNVDKNASFIGGEDSLYSFIIMNMKYHNECDASGKVELRFIVEKDSTISNIRILRDIGCGYGKELVRILKLIPKWSPAEKDSKAVRQEITLPFIISPS